MNAENRELNERLVLIESMLTEGRRTTAHWSWTSVLWGVTYFVAMTWSAWGPHGAIAWPVCVAAGLILTVAGMSGSRKHEKQPGTTLGRAIGSIWMGLGISMVLLFPALGLSGRLGDVHLFISVVSAFIGMAY